MLSRRRHTWPYAVGRVFYDGGADPARVIVQSGSGGIITGDKLRQRVSAGPGARAQVLGQGAMSVHRVGRSSGSREDLVLEAAEGSWVENLAEPRVLFGSSEFRQETVIRTTGDGVALSVEAVVLNEHDAGSAQYESSTAVLRNGELCARERMRLDGGDLPGGATAFALIVLAGLPYGADAWRLWAGRCRGPEAYGAANELPFGAGVAVRIVAEDGRRLRAGLDSALAVVREGAPWMSSS